MSYGWIVRFGHPSDLVQVFVMPLSPSFQDEFAVSVTFYAERNLRRVVRTLQRLRPLSTM